MTIDQPIDVSSLLTEDLQPVTQQHKIILSEIKAKVPLHVFSVQQYLRDVQRGVSGSVRQVVAELVWPSWTQRLCLACTSAAAHTWHHST